MLVNIWLAVITRVDLVWLAFALLAGWNGLAFLLYIIDKRRAIHGGRRIRERTLLFFAFAGGGAGAVLGMWLMRHKLRVGRFRVAGLLGMLVFLVPAVHIAHGLTLDRVVRFREVSFVHEHWPDALDGYRIAFMADFHVIAHEAMADVVAALNACGVDLLLLGGDFSMRTDHYAGTLGELAYVQAADGIWGVAGNHDYQARLFDAKRAVGITPLGNEGVVLREGFFLGGVYDLWQGTADVAAALYGAGAEDFVLLLTHNPDIVMRQPMAGVDLVLAGHTHGGQITFFGFPFYLLRGSITGYGVRFGRGWGASDCGVPVFTTAGVGVYYSVPRVFARPEVVIFTMNSQ